MTTALNSPIGSEILDGATCPPALARATLRDIARSNTLFGGRAAAWFGVKELLGGDPPSGEDRLTVLDIGAGGGDIAAHVVRRAKERGTILAPIAVDWHRAAAIMCRERGLTSAVADTWALPLAPRSVDIVVLSQVLHHFRRDAAVRLLREVSHLARLGVVVCDLRRSAAAAAGIWLAGWALGFHPITRRDGVTSVRRGFSVQGLSALLLAAGLPASVYRRPGYRLVAAWRASGADG